MADTEPDYEAEMQQIQKIETTIFDECITPILEAAPPIRRIWMQKQ